MCGIAGIFDANLIATNESLDVLLRRLSHRGPDHQAQWLSDSGAFRLGHTRLSIQDLSSGSHQPFIRGNLTLSFNGEIYNFLELRKQLQTEGHHFITSGDTEVILAAWEQWGVDAFQKFNGMWSIAIWDDLKQQLILSRDRYGVKPLFYCASNGRLAFASELDALSRCSFVPVELENQYLDASLSLGPVAESLSLSLLQGVFKLPPGCFLRVDLQRPQPELHRWWYQEQQHVDVAHSYRERQYQFRSLLDKALAIRARSDANVGVALSGGLDSGTVAAILQREFTAYTCDFKGPDSEAHLASMIMAGRPFEHQVIETTAPALKDMLLSAIQVGDVSTDTYVGLDTIYSKMQQDGIKVSIEGHGGDESLAGYQHYLQCAMMDRYYPDSPDFLEKLVTFAQNNVIDGNEMLINTLILAKSAPEHIEDQLLGGISQIKARDMVLPYNEPEQYFSSDDSAVKRRLKTDFHYNTLPAILRNFDRVSMRYGIEVRSPFLDWELVTFCRALPEQDLHYNGYSKRILRDTVTEMPKTVRMNQKKLGFASPFAGWFASVAPLHWRQLADLLRFCDEPAFAQYHLAKRLMDFADGIPLANIRHTWALICCSLTLSLMKNKIDYHDLP